MSSARRHAWLLGLATISLTFGSLTFGCAAQREEGSMPDSEADRSAYKGAEPVPDATAMEPVSEDQGERSLEDIQRELAANEAKLRALGVELAAAAGPGLGDASEGATTTTKEGEKSRERNRDNEDKAGAGAGGVISNSGGAIPPAAQPGGSTPRSKQRREDESRPKPSKKKDKNKKGESAGDLDGADGRFAQPPPDEAKAVPLSPGEQPQQDAVGRCEQICDLSVVTCELNVQICELADRHPDEDDYHAACERAAEDCEAAQEACDDCAG